MVEDVQVGTFWKNAEEVVLVRDVVDTDDGEYVFGIELPRFKWDEVNNFEFPTREFVEIYPEQVWPKWEQVKREKVKREPLPLVPAWSKEERSDEER